MAVVVIRSKLYINEEFSLFIKLSLIINKLLWCVFLDLIMYMFQKTIHKIFILPTIYIKFKNFFSFLFCHYILIMEYLLH